MSDHKGLVEVFGIRDADAGAGCNYGEDSDSIPSEGTACPLPSGDNSPGCCETSTTV